MPRIGLFLLIMFTDLSTEIVDSYQAFSNVQRLAEKNEKMHGGIWILIVRLCSHCRNLLVNVGNSYLEWLYLSCKMAALVFVALPV